MEKDAGVILAKTAGFCPGVKKAIDRVLELSQQGKHPIFTLGPLIHNAQVISMLEEKGIHAVKSLADIPAKEGVIVLRAHGITPELEAEVRAYGIEVIDATCPLVKNVHSVIEKHVGEGFTTVIVGDAGHAEVVGLQGYAGKDAFVVSGPEEAEQLPRLEKALVVAQTTQEEDVFEATAEVVRRKAGTVVVSNTICKPTRDRQRETVELAKSSDLVVIVGGKHSANTARLAALCRRLCPDTVHIETEEELDLDAVRSARSVAITAGASTPSWMTDRVLGRIREARKTGLRPALLDAAGQALELLINSCLYTAFGAFCLTYVCMRLQGCRLQWEPAALSGLFVLSLHLINRIGERGVGTLESRKLELLQKHKLPLTASALLSGLAAMGLAFALDLRTFLVVVLSWVVGALYPFRSLYNLQGFLDVPGSKDFATALGWGFVCAVVPGLHQGMVFSKANYLAVLFAILLVFVRSAMLGISAVHSDLIVGKENFYKALGERRTHAVLLAIQVLLSLLLVALLSMRWKTPLVVALLLANLYPIACLLFGYFRRTLKGFWAETLVDGQFLFFALLAWLSR